MSIPVTVTTTVKEQPNCVHGLWICCNTRYQLLLDKSTAHPGVRWIVWLLFLTVYLVRAYLLQGWYIVTYALGIYILNLFISFLSPKVDPATLDYDDDGPTLPTSANEEFRPFIRRLPEFKFWHNAMRAVLVALFCTFFEVFNVPVFWPILVMYFVILFVLTMKKQILHMIHYRYLPFSYGKTRYKGKDDVPLKSENGPSVGVGPSPAPVKNV